MGPPSPWLIAGSLLHRSHRAIACLSVRSLYRLRGRASRLLRRGPLEEAWRHGTLPWTEALLSAIIIAIPFIVVLLLNFVDKVDRARGGAISSMCKSRGFLSSADVVAQT